MNDQAVSQLVLFGLLIAFMVFVLWRSRQRQKATTQMQQSLKPGDEVMLTSGIFGTIVAMDDERAQIQVSDDVVLAVHRGALGKLVVPAGGADAAGDTAVAGADETFEAHDSDPHSPGTAADSTATDPTGTDSTATDPTGSATDPTGTDSTATDSTATDSTAADVADAERDDRRS